MGGIPAESRRFCFFAVLFGRADRGGVRLLQGLILYGRRTIIASDANDFRLIGEEAFVAVVARNDGERKCVGIAVSVELSWRVMNGVASGHGGLCGVAGGLTQGFKRGGIGRSAVFVSGELMLERLDGFESGAFSGGAGVLKAQRKGEPDNGPDARNGDNNGDQELR